MAKSEVNGNDSLSVEQVIETAAREAGKILLQHFGTADVQEKSTQNLVTQADLESEQLIGDIIQDAFPNHTMMQEETEFQGDLLADHLWVVDPLDGTNNYAHGIPHFCVSIAYCQQGRLQSGAVYDPMRDELFTATSGQGAKLNGRPISVSHPSGLDRSVVATGFFYDRGAMMKQTLGAIETLFENNVRGIRRMGAAALDLAWVACGRFEGFFEHQLAPWDYAAGALLVTESGGVVRSGAGEAMHLEMNSVIASSSEIADELAELVAWRPT